jgi:hypothetical protein
MKVRRREAQLAAAMSVASNAFLVDQVPQVHQPVDSKLVGVELPALNECCNMRFQ